MNQHPDSDSQHFRRRRKQVVVTGLALVAVVVAIALIQFKQDVAAASLEQKWGLWRDEHCTTDDSMPSAREQASLYDPAHTRGAPGTWACDDGQTYTLENSDKPPKEWRPPVTID